MRTCVSKQSSRDSTVSAFSMKETLFFLMRKLQDKESQVSAMKLMISERDEKIAHLETYVGALLEKMRHLEDASALNQARRTSNRGSQTKLDENSSRRSWYGGKQAQENTKREPPMNPYATLPRNRVGRNRSGYVSRGTGLAEPQQNRCSKATQTLSNSDPSSSVQLFTIKLLRNELFKVSEELRLLEKRIHEIVFVKEQRVHNSEDLIKTCQHHLKTQTVRWREIPYNVEREVPTYKQSPNPYTIDQDYIGEETEADGMQRLEENIRLLEQEIKYRTSELTIIEENIDDLVEVCDSIRTADRRIHETLDKEASAVPVASAKVLDGEASKKGNPDKRAEQADRIRPFSHFVELDESLMSDDGDV